MSDKYDFSKLAKKCEYILQENICISSEKQEQKEIGDLIFVK